MGRRKITLEAVNERRKAARVGLVVIQRGNKLSLKGTLPPKPGSSKLSPHQQTISLGIYANPAGLEHAEAKALELGALVAQKRFSWVAIESDRDHADSCAVWVEAFRKYALQNLINSSGEKADLNWRDQFWYPAFSKLDQNSDLCRESIIKAVQKTRHCSMAR